MNSNKKNQQQKNSKLKNRTQLFIPSVFSGHLKRKTSTPSGSGRALSHDERLKHVEELRTLLHALTTPPTPSPEA